MDKEPTLKGKGLGIGRNDESVLLGSLAARSIISAEETVSESSLKGKGLNTIDRPHLSESDEGAIAKYRSIKNGDFYVIADGPVKEGLVRLRNIRNGSIVTLSLDVLSDSERFVLDDA